jgi:hypothetical protein
MINNNFGFLGGFSGGFAPPLVGGGAPPYVDPVPDFLLKYLLDGNDSSLVPINSPTIVTGLDLPDLKATSFNGVDQYYNANADSSIMAIGASAFSIAFRMKTAVTAARTITESGSSTLPSGFKINTRGVGGLSFKTDNTVLNLGDNRYLDDVWIHTVITGTGSGGTLTFYVNGVANATTRTLPTYSFTDTNNFMVGENGLPAIIDDLRVYDRVLSQVEITALNDNV